MDNGLLFCLCPVLTCDGNIKVMGMDGGDGQEKFLFTKELFTCWPYVQACAQVCVPLGVCCNSMDGCKNYCSGTEFKTITQPVFKGPWKRGQGNPEKIGEFVITQRFEPVGMCCAAPVPIKYYYKPLTPDGDNLVEDELAALSLVLQLYKGMPVPCKHFSPAGFQVPTGVSCMDLGLMVQTKWNSVQDVLKDAEG